MGSKLAALAATLCAGGCMGSFSLADSSEPPEPEVLWIMVGAEVELHLNDCASQHDQRLVHCVPSNVGELKSIEVGEAFEILASKSAEGDAQVLLRARQEGSTSLKYVYRDGHGNEQRGELLLEAAYPDRMSASVDCESGRGESADAIVIGAGSELHVSLHAFTALGEQLETGSLALFEFPGFEQLERTENHVRLRAPLGAGSYAWPNALQEQVEVRVIDQVGVNFRSQEFATGPTELLLTQAADPSGKTICTTPLDATVHVKVESGDCQLASNGVRFAGVVPLPSPEYAGSRLELWGAGECAVSAQASGSEPVTIPVSPRAWDEPTPEGTTLGTTPVPSSLLDALPTNECNGGYLDGTCERPEAPGLDDDCTAGTGVQIELSDTRGPIGAEPLGAGLVSSAALSAVSGPARSKLNRTPMGVSYSINSPIMASAEIGECLWSSYTRVAHVKLEGAGAGQLEFRASNLEAPAQAPFELREVASCTIEGTFDYDTFSDAAVPVFAGSSLALAAQCHDAEGNMLRGEPPLELTSDQVENQARLESDGKLFVGRAPGQVQLRPAVGSAGQVLEVVGAEAAHTLAATVRADSVLPGYLFVKVSAFDQAGRKIQGAGDVPMTVEIPADGGWLVDLGHTYLRTVAVLPVASAPGTVTVTVGEVRTEIALVQPAAQ